MLELSVVIAFWLISLGKRSSYASLFFVAITLLRVM